jgi:dUTP pyrophosphatase
MRVLKLCVALPHVKEIYMALVDNHNREVEHNLYANAGFDLVFPETLCLIEGTHKIDLAVRCAMYEEGKRPSAFYLYPRSSIYKTPLRLSNSVGIIDSGYRGNLGAVFDVSGPYECLEGQRFVQICAPSLEPFKVILVDDLDETSRGSEGFGSTGLF